MSGHQYPAEKKRSIWWKPAHLLDYNDPLDYIPGQDIKYHNWSEKAADNAPCVSHKKEEQITTE